MPQTFLTGKDAAFYVNATALTAAVAASSFVAGDIRKNVMDLSYSIGQNTEDITTRADGDFDAEAPTTKSASIKFKVKNLPGDAFVALLRTAYFSNSVVFAGALDQVATITGAAGLAGNWFVNTFDAAQPVKGVQTFDVELKPNGFTAGFVKAAV